MIYLCHICNNFEHWHPGVIQSHFRYQHPDEHILCWSFYYHKNPPSNNSKNLGSSDGQEVRSTIQTKIHECIRETFSPVMCCWRLQGYSIKRQSQQPEVRKHRDVIDRYHVFTFLSLVLRGVLFPSRHRVVIQITKFEA